MESVIRTKALLAQTTPAFVATIRHCGALPTTIAAQIMVLTLLVTRRYLVIKWETPRLLVHCKQSCLSPGPFKTIISSFSLPFSPNANSGIGAPSLSLESVTWPPWIFKPGAWPQRTHLQPVGVASSGDSLLSLLACHMHPLDRSSGK